MLTTTFKITGMHCASCKVLIEDVVQELSGVSRCEVDPTTGMATVTHDGTLDTESLKKEIEGLGEYKIETMV